MVLDAIDPAADLPWDTEFVWVQKSALLKVLSSDGSTTRVRQHDGVEASLTKAEVDGDYFPIEAGTILKPRYAPVKAICLAEDASVLIGGSVIELRAGSAVLQLEGGVYRAIPVDQYQRDYQAVAYPGTTEKPSIPFPDPE